MNMATNRFSRRFAGITASAALLFTAACDNPIGHEHDHLEARGVVITDMAGTTIAETHGNHWHYASGSDIHLHVGEEMDVRIWFVDPAGERFQVTDHHHDHEMVVQIANPAIATYGGHGDHGHFEGESAGETTAVIHLWHGNHPAGHADYSSPPLTLEVVSHGHHSH
jgi:hypothetical protein